MSLHSFLDEERCKWQTANCIPGLDFWLPPNIPENESGLMNFEEPLKLPFRTAHSSVFLHHPPPFKERNKIGSIHCSRKRRIRQKYANSKSISLIAFVPPCEPPSCWRQSQSRPRSGRPGGSHPSTLRHDKSQGQPMDNREQKLQCREWQEGARTCSFGHRVLQEHHLHFRRTGLG